MPPPIQVDDGDETKGDMTPMIDVIFLLLIFFLLTTSFITPEKVISNLLPTNKGPRGWPPEETHDVSVCIFPSGLLGIDSEQELDRRWKDDVAALSCRVSMRVGSRGPILEIDGARLGSVNPAACEAEMDGILAFLDAELARREWADRPRDQQDPVVIHCFSGLPWKYALVAYDAVRAYEAAHPAAPPAATTAYLDHTQLERAREVDFAPPRVRNYHPWEKGKELNEIMKMR